MGARRGRDAGDPRPLPVRHLRPPGAERAILRGGRRRRRGPGRGARERSRPRRRTARRPEASRADERLDARTREARGSGRDRRRARPARAREEMNRLPLAGRRLYFVGIGGAGLSAYANISRAWGAEVRGWEARKTIFMETLDGVEVDIGGEPRPPEGFEVVVSAAHAGRAAGTSRAEFLADLVAGRRSIVVAGAHGKTTTAAMIAYVLRELGEDPAWIVGGVVPQLGGNAGTGSGWLAVEGDESDRSVAFLEPEVAAVTKVELATPAAF